jgi:hypothetical protein
MPSGMHSNPCPRVLAISRACIAVLPASLNNHGDTKFLLVNCVEKTPVRKFTGRSVEQTVSTIQNLKQLENIILELSPAKSISSIYQKASFPFCVEAHNGLCYYGV